MRRPERHHEISDADVAALRAHRSDAAVVTLAVAVGLFDTHCRWRLAFDVTPSPLSARDVATLRLTDVLIRDPQPVSPALQAELRSHFTDAQIVDLAVGVGIFHALSRVLVVLGLEPEHMPTTAIPTPTAPD